MVIQAVLDRIEEKRHAVLLVGEEEKEVVVPFDQIPDRAGEGTWLTLTYQGEELISIQIDTQKTAQVKRTIRDKMRSMRQKSGSRFKKG